MLPWIPEDAPPDSFPPTDFAFDDPNGLLAAGGDLSPERLVSAYRRGIFPWYSPGQPILWWTPDPRTVLLPGAMKISRSLRKRIRSGTYRITVDQDFAAVIDGCAAPRSDQSGTWIDRDMRRAYLRLHGLGVAHSIETRDGDQLVGGLYGIAMGRVFFGESMFTRATDASKVALAHLNTLGFELIDCQLPNPHLASLGARDISRTEFEQRLDASVAGTPVFAAVPPR